MLDTDIQFIGSNIKQETMINLRQLLCEYLEENRFSSVVDQEDADFESISLVKFFDINKRGNGAYIEVDKRLNFAEGDVIGVFTEHASDIITPIV